MNQINNLSQFKISSIQGRTSLGSCFNGAGQDSGNAGGQIGVDEMVFDANSGTFATFQAPPELISLLNSRDGACSFII